MTTTRRIAPHRALVALTALFALIFGGSPAAEADAPGLAPLPSTAGLLESSGVPRTFRTYVPPMHSAHPPLVIVLHGTQADGALVERQFGFDAEADARGFVVVYPDGTGMAWNAGTCCGAPRRSGIDDVGFLADLVAREIRDDGVDPRRVYLAGFSNGAFLAYAAACSGRFPIAAIAPVSGTITSACDAAAPTSVLAIHGLADRNVLFGGLGPDRPSVPATIDRWRAIDACSAPTIAQRGRVRTERSRCANDRVVELVTVAGLAHAWSGARRGAHDPLDATATIGAFFASVPPGAVAGGAAIRGGTVRP